MLLNTKQYYKCTMEVEETISLEMHQMHLNVSINREDFFFILCESSLLHHYFEHKLRCVYCFYYIFCLQYLLYNTGTIILPFYIQAMYLQNQHTYLQLYITPIQLQSVNSGHVQSGYHTLRPLGTFIHKVELIVVPCIKEINVVLVARL